MGVSKQAPISEVVPPSVEAAEFVSAVPECNSDALAAMGTVAAESDTPYLDACPTSTTVEPGDQLWGLSEAMTGSGRNWPELHAANADQIDDPDLIYPGQELAYPPGWVENCERDLYGQGESATPECADDMGAPMPTPPSTYIDEPGPMCEDRPMPDDKTLWFDTTANGGNYSFSGGLHEEKGEDGTLGLFTAKGRAGTHGDPGKRREGFSGKACMVDAETDWDGPINFDGQFLCANVDGEIGEDGYSFGSGASVASAAVTLGDKHADGEDAHDLMVRGGVGLGVGTSARSHWGDEDGDGIPEAGFGVDAEFVSLDVKSETLGHATNAAYDTLTGPMDIIDEAAMLR